MTFPEKSALTMTVILLTVFGGYFVLVLGTVAGSPGRDFAFTGLMVAATILVTVLAAVSHAVLAIVFRRQADFLDERDRLIALRAARIAGFLLAVGVCAGIILAGMRVDPFWIAQALIAALVVAEVTNGAAKLVLYRRGV